MATCSSLKPLVLSCPRRASGQVADASEDWTTLHDSVIMANSTNDKLIELLRLDLNSLVLLAGVINFKSQRAFCKRINQSINQSIGRSIDEAANSVDLLELEMSSEAS